ncbi:MAG: transposase zinc-binding domain-containing protein [Nannocystis sp.]|nr:transposase zinc-binding domain-containing protein [Nannocystis sp.]
MPACLRPGVYVPRQTHDSDAAVLVRRHLPGLLARLEEAGHALPEFVKAELDGFAGCGDFEKGFVRTACRTCGDELRVPFACKGRGFCPSCMGRRMAEGAALLVDHVLPAVGVRQWVLSFEGRMAVRLGYDRALLARVAGAFARALIHDMRWEVKARHGLASVQPLHAGVFTAVQRFRSDLGLYVHLHCLVTDGAFEEAGADVRFLPARAPTQRRMTAVVADVWAALLLVAAPCSRRSTRPSPPTPRTTTSTSTRRSPPACSSPSPAHTPPRRRSPRPGRR